MSAEPCAYCGQIESHWLTCKRPRDIVGSLRQQLDAARAEVTAAYALGLEALGILSPAGDSGEGLVAAAKRVVAERDAARAEVLEAEQGRVSAVGDLHAQQEATTRVEDAFDAARAEAARERRGREVAEARAAYWKARYEVATTDASIGAGIAADAAMTAAIARLMVLGAGPEVGR
jgi:hypothetical protein